MSVSIDALIAKRLEIPEERARDLLRAMMKELRNRAQEDGIRLPNLGRFQEEEGTLSFTPSASLERLVNKQYEGLPPEALSTPPEPDPEEEDVPPFLFDDPGEAAPEESPAAPESPASEQRSPYEPPSAMSDSEERSPSESPDDADASRDRPYRESPGASDWSGEAPDYPILEDQPESDVGAESSSPSPESSSEDEPERRREPVEETERPPEPAAQEDEETSGFRPPDSFNIIAGLLLVLLVVAFGWFVFTQTGLLSSSPGSGSEPMATNGEQETTQTPTEADAEPSSPEQQQPARFRGVPPEGESDSDEASPPAGGWTVVVASTSDRASADAIAGEYRDRFGDASLSVNVRPGTVDNQTRYRVTVGQFRSRETALNAVDNYAAELPSDAWTLQLR